MMKIRTLLLLLPALLLSGLPAKAAEPAAEENARVIVRFKPQADSVRARILSARMTRGEVSEVAQTRASALGLRTGLGGARMKARLSLDERTHVFTASGESSAALAKRLAKDSEVEFVAVDQRRRRSSATLPNDPLYGGATPLPLTVVNANLSTRTIDQWYLKAPTPEVVSGINAPLAWGITTGASTVVVAVLDTGVRKDHPDLAGQFVGGWDMIGLNATSTNTAQSIAVAGDGDLSDNDASDPGDFVTQTEVSNGSLGSGCTSADVGASSWHGTRVSGLIAALTDNGLGMAGVAKGVKILPVRVLGKCGGWDSDIIAGMKWAAGVSFSGQPSVNPNPAKVLNMSLGGSGACGTTGTGALYREAINSITAAGATIVVAAGNENGKAVGVPGNCPGVISVGALRHAGSKVGFASVGTEVTLSAPGGNCVNGEGLPCLYPMVSTTNSGTTAPVAADNAYTGSSQSVGTSFSAPIVAGTVALMLSAKPTLTPSEIKTILQSTVRSFVTSGATAGTAACHAPTNAEQLECYCTTSTCGAGMLDAGAAVTMAQAAGGGTVTVAATPATGAVAGQTVSFTATPSLPSGLTVASIAWSVVSGPGANGFASGATTNTATLVTTGAGTLVVQATVTDNLGFTRSGQASVTLAPAAASGTVSVASSPASPTAGQSVTLTIGSSTLGTGRSVASAVWSVTASGAGVTAIASGANSTTATISPTVAGSVTVQVQVTDNLGATYTASGTITVAAAPTTPSTSGGGGGGGGAASPVWLALLACAAWALRRRPA